MAPYYHGELNAAALADPNNTHGKVLGLVGSGKRVLEIGCATGYMTRQMIVSQRCEVTALEVDPEAARLAREVGATVLTGDVEKDGLLEQLEGRFDVIVLADVLEHLREPWTLLNRLKSVLVPGGHLIVSAPNVAHWTVRTRLLLGRFEYGEKGILDSNHLQFFTSRSIVRLITGSGYKIIRSDVMYIFPFHRRLGLHRLAEKWMLPGWLSGLFGYQFIIEASSE
ncbi:MAG: class I SAM-dependent methyltransferase [Dehalococcoidia bacterium]|nr:class I SAM-dependent methyltransferase [Dehalococcoidia bacterium]